MRVRIAAATCAALVLVGLLGAPALPVMGGIALAYGWLLWREVASR